MTRGRQLTLGRASLWLGIGSCAAIPVAIAVGIAVEVLGIVSLLRGLVLPLAVLAAALGLMSRLQSGAADSPDRRAASLGIALGITSIGIVFLVIGAVAFLFGFLLRAQV